MRITKGQDWFIECMKQLGYRSDEGGICFGLAHMGMQAMHAELLSEGLATFNQRLLKIHEIYDAAMQETKSALSTDTSDEFKAIFRTKLESKLKSESFDISAFFEGVELYQNMIFYPQLFEERPRHTAVSSASSMVLPIVQSIAIESKKIGVVSGAEFIGTYKNDDLITYFREISAALEAQSFAHPVSLILQSSNHAITVGYDPVERKWLLIDANKLPTQSFQTHAEIAQAVLSAFSKNDVACFSTKIYAPESQHAELQNIINICSAQDEWKIIHEINRDKVRLKDSNGANLFHIAAQAGYLAEIIHVLTLMQQENNFSYATTTTNNGTSALAFAVLGGQFNVSRYLLEQEGVDPNQEIAGADTPLCIAAQHDDADTFRLLISKGADPNRARRSDGYFPMHIAATRDSVNVLNALLPPGNPNHPLIDGFTSLHCAALFGRLNAVALLLSKGANPNSRANDGSTPLHVAAWHGDFKVVESLLAAGTNPSLKTINGHTPFDIATMFGHSAIANLLGSYRDADSPSLFKTHREEGVLPPANQQPDDPTKPKISQ